MNITCPECNSDIQFWVEEVIEHRKVVDAKTGRLKKSTQKVSTGNSTYNMGYCCTKCQWNCGGDEEEAEHFNNVCNETALEEFINSINNL